jgi:hypothetical protein
MATDKPAPNPVLKRLAGTLFSFLVIGVGTSMLVSPDSWGPESLTSETGRSKARMAKAALRWMFENIGQTPTGAVIAAIGVVSLVLIWKPVLFRKSGGA